MSSEVEDMQEASLTPRYDKPVSVDCLLHNGALAF